MTSNLVFILEDEPDDRIILEGRIKDIGLSPTTCSNLYDARKNFETTNVDYIAYFLDMQVPIFPNDPPTHLGGLELRDYLVKREIDPKKIFLVSGVVSFNDERAAMEYNFPTNQIIGKDQLTELFLRKLLKKWNGTAR